MATREELLLLISELCKGAEVTEEVQRITINGPELTNEAKQKILSILKLFDQLKLAAPVLSVGNESVSLEDLIDDNFLESDFWRLVISKGAFAAEMRARESENTVFFLSMERLNLLLSKFDPFVSPVGFELDFSTPLTIRVFDLEQGFGGPSLWILGVNEASPSPVGSSKPLASAEEVQALVHTTGSERSLRICPAGFLLNWGALENKEARPMLLLSAYVLAACLSQELKRVDGSYEVTLRGTKRVTLKLTGEAIDVTKDAYDLLVNSVSWVFEERAETRQRLIMDRLSIECQPEDKMLTCLFDHLQAAYQQARDSYTFVILDRKDAYHKEMRELMKDMKSQADLYAAKVRDLVNSITRDVLGVLVFIGFSFIGKFDHKNLEQLLTSSELSLLVKILAAYLIMSCTLQLLAHWRDASLGYAESKKWLDVLQHYTSRKEKEDTFLCLLTMRRITLTIAMIIAFIIYSALVIIVWNLPFVIQLLLSQ